ncbi:MAG: hypothetical protein HFJ52_00295 [Clostridia bacterium]|jgi:hypothetical protein|nr:hypothetical protein [Clostridia bacterium]
MDKLERFFEDIHAIREILESKARVKESCADSVEPQTPIAPVQPVNPVPVQPAPVTPVAQVVPTAPQAESFTFDQIARAMSNAQAMGRTDLIQSIFTTFKAQTLMQIDPVNYNQIAVMLREAGIQI